MIRIRCGSCEAFHFMQLLGNPLLESIPIHLIANRHTWVQWWWVFRVVKIFIIYFIFIRLQRAHINISLWSSPFLSVRLNLDRTGTLSVVFLQTLRPPLTYWPEHEHVCKSCSSWPWTTIYYCGYHKYAGEKADSRDNFFHSHFHHSQSPQSSSNDRWRCSKIVGLALSISPRTACDDNSRKVRDGTDAE